MMRSVFTLGLGLSLAGLAFGCSAERAGRDVASESGEANGATATPGAAANSDSDSDSEAAADPESPTAVPKDERVAGVYEVPTDPELTDFATNPVRVRLRAVEGGGFELKYHLPEVIAGIDREVDLVATKTGQGSWQLAGASGSGSCTASAEGDFVCHELLDGVVMSLPEATAAVNAVSQTEAERRARQAVAERFITDPLGIVRFKSTARGR
jgi:hypothetical protein